MILLSGGLVTFDGGDGDKRVWNDFLLWSFCEATLRPLRTEN